VKESVAQIHRRHIAAKPIARFALKMQTMIAGSKRG